jgi:hypothetical protein
MGISVGAILIAATPAVPSGDQRTEHDTIEFGDEQRLGVGAQQQSEPSGESLTLAELSGAAQRSSTAAMSSAVALRIVRSGKELHMFAWSAADRGAASESRHRPIGVWARGCPRSGPNPQEPPGNRRYLRRGPSSGCPAKRPVSGPIGSRLKIVVSPVRIWVSPCRLFPAQRRGAARGHSERRSGSMSGGQRCARALKSRVEDLQPGFELIKLRRGMDRAT